MRRLGLLLLIALSCACAEEERAPVAPRPGYNVTETKNTPMREVLQRTVDPDDLLVCDIRKVDCQVRVFEETKATRGTDGPRPPVDVATEAEFARLFAEAGGTGAPDDAVRLLSLLHLISPRTSDGEPGEDDFDSLLAVYFFITDEVVVIDHGRPLDSVEATLTLSHEFVHALQDAEHDLLALSEQAVTIDQRQGHLGLIEGEAEVYASLVVTGEVNERRTSWRNLRRAVLEAALSTDAPFYVADLHFPYTYGNEFMTFTWLETGDAGVAARYDNPPRSSREVLAGQGAPVPAGGWVEEITGTSAAAVPDGFSPVIEDALGAFTFHLFLEVLGSERGRRNVRLPEESVAMNLRGDAVVAYRRDDGPMVAVWRLRFEQSIAPADVIAEIESNAGGAFVVREQRGDVLVFAADDRSLAQTFAAGFELPEAGVAARSIGTPPRMPPFRRPFMR